MRQVRARNERVQQADLVGAVGDARVLGGAVEHAARRVERARAAIGEATATRDRALAGGAATATIAGLARLDGYLGRLRHELDGALGELVRAQARHRGQLAAVDVARGRLAVARAEREVIERHFAAWRAAREKLADRRDD